MSKKKEKTETTVKAKPCRWSEKEDQVMIRHIKHSVNNLHMAFLLTSQELADNGIERTPIGVSAHWYSVVSKRPDVWIFGVIAASHFSRNRKNGAGVPVEPSVWRRIVRIFQSIK